MIGLMPVQRQAGPLGIVPSCSANAARFIGSHLFAGIYKRSHFPHACGVTGSSIGVLAEQAETFLADRRRIAWHPVYMF
jgi:hypothetical protein